MSRWQIRSLLFFSHDNRRVVIGLTPAAVNIIVGVSYTGKSALIEAFDYCMGSGECHIPGIVREACSWVGVLWEKEKTQILICRAIPRPPKKSSEDVHFVLGRSVEIPDGAEGLRRTTNVDGALRQFEQALLLSDVVGETFTERSPTRISVRHALPYVLQSDDVIISKATLFRGANDERKRSLVDSIPYFLGAVDESAAYAEGRLRTLRSSRDREQSRRAAQNSDDAETLERALALLGEAQALGMLSGVAADTEASVVIEALRAAADWSGEEVGPADGNRLLELVAKEREDLAALARCRSRLNAAAEVLHTADGFATTAERQRGKLDVVRAFNQESERDKCPVCDGPIAERTPTLARIQDALTQLGTELDEVQRDRPQIDSYVRSLESQLAEAAQALAQTRQQIAAVVLEAETNSNRLGIDQRRSRVAGRVSYFLETHDAARQPEEPGRLEAILAEIAKLEALTQPDAKLERIATLQQQTSAHVAELLRDLPFDEHFRDAVPSFDARQLSLFFVRGQQSLSLKDIGGDESYLSAHVATLLALHRIFAAGNRPVPGVVFFDQLSRPFFPPDSKPGEVAVTTTDRADLKQYFDIIFNEVERQRDLQVIVLEHAYFTDDDRYTQAVRVRWDDTTKLIPNDWPRVLLGGQAGDASTEEET